MKVKINTNEDSGFACEMSVSWKDHKFEGIIEEVIIKTIPEKVLNKLERDDLMEAFQILKSFKAGQKIRRREKNENKKIE